MRDMSTRRNYEELCIIGRGAYGTVFKAKDTENDRIVALKRVRIVNNTEEKGVPVSTLREITLLKQLDNMAHPNIVRMFDAFQTFSTTPTDSPQDLVLTIVFEHVEQDLSTFLHNSPHGLSEDVIKDLMHQLLSGIDYLHTNRMVHRDVKPQNILISKNKQVKIADFGLARVYGFCKLVTSVVVTLWYRAPEILLHGPYATMVDLWSVGTIMAEMYNRRPLFRGKSDVNQLHKILSVIGSPEKKEWPDVSLPWSSFCNYLSTDLHDLIPDMSSEGIDLISKILVFDPNKRYNARSCLLHPYFDNVDHDSQDSGIYGQRDAMHKHFPKNYTEYTEQIMHYENEETENQKPKTGYVNHERNECMIETPCVPNPDTCLNENENSSKDSSRSSDSGLENIPKHNISGDIDKLNTSLHETSFHEPSMSNESKTLTGVLTENQTIISDYSRTLNRSDSGIGISPQPSCSYSNDSHHSNDNKQYCSSGESPPVCKKTFEVSPNGTHEQIVEQREIFALNDEKREIFAHKDEKREIFAHKDHYEHVTTDVITTTDKQLTSVTATGRIRPHEPDSIETRNNHPPHKRFRPDEAQV